MANDWQRPVFPLTGDDVLSAGITKGPAVGVVLGDVEAWWIDNGFTLDTIALQKVLHTAITKIR
jgi:poly(A) polymerase